MDGQVDPITRIDLMQRDLDALHDLAVQHDLERTLALIVLMADLAPELSIGEALRRLPWARDLVSPPIRSE
jgi:hypothetical protein